jgi:hypothetical protein
MWFARNCRLLFDLTGELKRYGMKAAFDEIMASGVKRQQESWAQLASVSRDVWSKFVTKS